jgi:GxxExxY protein
VCKRTEPSAHVDVLASKVLDAAFEVHRTLGSGFLESVYEEALAHELGIRGLAFQRQLCVSVNYKGKHVGEGRVDFLVESELIVETKAIECFAPIHLAQVISYLRATGYPLGLLINFNVPLLKDGIKRIVLTNQS